MCDNHFSPHPFPSYVVADRKSDSTCLVGKCHFFTKRHPEGIFYSSLSQFTTICFLFFTYETEFYPKVPQMSTASTLQRTERAHTIYLVQLTLKRNKFPQVFPRKFARVGSRRIVKNSICEFTRENWSAESLLGNRLKTVGLVNGTEELRCQDLAQMLLTKGITHYLQVEFLRDDCY